ncbi:hypothetical protein ES703_105196 [subsurface metagenome]
MSPIKGVSELRRMPRLGKIRLGIKQISPRTENPYPVATDYFVVPDEIKRYVGDKPKALKIMFPVENLTEFAIQWLRCYSFTQGLVCKGDGFLARRKEDVATGAMANHTTVEWVWKDGLPCDPETCPEYSGEKPQCRRVMNLLFLMPDVPGFGVWQLDTSSFYSIVNINSCIDLIRRLCGRISFIPLTLSLEPQIVEPPGIKKKTVHILQIRSDVKLAEIQRLGRRRPEQVLLPELDEEEIPPDLYPEGVLAEAEGLEPPTEPPGESETTKIASVAAEPEGEGFHIDLQWLEESQKALRWSDDTMKSFLLKYKVDISGTLTEVLQRLTREQAEEFTKQINSRREKQTSLF